MRAGKQQMRIRYEGTVQGVGFRWTVRKIALPLAVTGGVANQLDGSVILLAEGTPDQLQRLRLQIQTSRLGPYIINETVSWAVAEGLEGFYYR